MQYRKLPNTDITLSAVTLGCMAFTGDSNWGPQAEQDSIDTVRAALDAGITSFDTAEMYADGLTEIILGKALGADRSRAVIASKVNKEHLRRGDLITACENSLRRQEVMKTLNKMKNESDLLCYGETAWIATDAPECVLAFKRVLDEKEITFVGNAKNCEAVIDSSIIDGKKCVLSNGEHKVCDGKLTLKPYEYIVVE